MKAYVVLAYNGDYSDKWTGVLCCFAAEEQAKVFVDWLIAAAKKADSAFDEAERVQREIDPSGAQWKDVGWRTCRDSATATWRNELEAFGLPEDFSDRESSFEYVETEFIGAQS